ENGEVQIPITDLYDSISDNAGACGITVTVGGEGVTACETNYPSNNQEDGLGVLSTLIIANDFDVEEGADFTIETFTPVIIAAPGTVIAQANIAFREDASGTPGAIIQSYDALPSTSQTVTGNNFGFDFFAT